jgi:hypothetical protein
MDAKLAFSGSKSLNDYMTSNKLAIQILIPIVSGPISGKITPIQGAHYV